MAEAPPARGKPPSSGPPRAGGNPITRKIGPLPTYVWAAIALGGIYVYRKYKANQASSSTGTATNGAIVSAPLPLTGSSTGGGSSGGGGGGGGGWWSRWNAGQHGTRSTNTSTLQTPEGNQAAIPVTLPPVAQAQPLQIPSAQALAAMFPTYTPLTAAQDQALSVLEQPQNQPSTNPFVLPTPVTQEAVGQAGPVASGVGQRYVTPGGPGGPYAFTFG